MLNENELFHEVFIDIDIKIEEFPNTKTYELVKKNIELLTHRYSFVVYWRRSASGNVHLKLYFPVGLTPLEHFMVRAMLHDDIYRIGIDLRRLWLYGIGEINRLFTVKNGNKAGEWQPFP